ncbi:MAG: 3-methyl-2-oxobutanoate hydroxymethyltransferase [Alphaproteobacteria bacterium]|nr:3-methyl-2-oxobutanoate hydroxymethyltransferase [Alphaproteobacteria bacterium]
MKLEVKDIVKGGKPIVCLTSYTAPMARIVDPLVDVILVGDSLGMVVYGFENTLPVTLDMMIAHGGAVARNATHAMVVVDMPYGTYESSKELALKNAQRIMKETGCAAVKPEGGQELAETVRYLVNNGVPVMGHIGLMPQSIEKMGGFKIQGRGDAGAQKVMADAKAIADAGAFSMVVEGTIEPVAKDITEAVNIPTIGIGASPACDGQILVVDDILGMYAPFTPKFVKRYVELAPIISEAVKQYADEVKARTFPTMGHCFLPK